jgi:hypothetical protein
MNKAAFYGGLITIAIGLAMWILRPNQASRKSRVKFLGFDFSFDTPAFGVMLIGIVLMILSPRFPDYWTSPLKLTPTKIVCTGEFEANCPGAHDIFYTCGYFGSDQQIADRVCEGIKSGALRLKTVGGNMCGYSLIQVTCQP